MIIFGKIVLMKFISGCTVMAEVGQHIIVAEGETLYDPGGTVCCCLFFFSNGSFTFRGTLKTLFSCEIKMVPLLILSLLITLN